MNSDGKCVYIVTYEVRTAPKTKTLFLVLNISPSLKFGDRWHLLCMAQGALCTGNHVFSKQPNAEAAAHCCGNGF